MANAAVHYTIRAIPNRHLFVVSVTLQQPDAEGQRFTLPTWIPGSYMIRDFAKHLGPLTAVAADQTVAVKKIDKTTWQCQAVLAPLTLHYEVYAWDLSVRGAHLDNTHGFFNGTSVFLCPVGQEQQAISVDIQRPEGEEFQQWRVGTALSTAVENRYQFALYQAEDYDELLDHPVEMADFTLAQFEACGITHDIILTGQHRADMTRLKRDLKKLCQQQLEFFAEPYPIERYVFLILVLEQGFGGLEHRASTSLHCSRHELPLSTDDQDSCHEEYANFLALCSHEYFHTWNIKRIKPAAFLPYPLEKESHTTLLWVFEGFTRYYEDLMLLRADLLSVEQFLQHLAQLITLYEKNYGRTQQTLAESSFDAWTKFYKADENAPNAIVSYYTKGGIVALLLDLKLRHCSAGDFSLDALMQRLWQDYGRQQRGLQEGEIETVINQCLGEDLTSFYQQYVYGLAELPYQQLLATVGIECHFRAATDNSDKGGSAVAASEQRAQLGLAGEYTAAGLKVKNVYSHSAAEAAAIAPGDVIIAFAGLQVRADWQKQLASYAVGEELSVTLFRGDVLMQRQAMLQATPVDRCQLSVSATANEQQLTARARWLQVPLTKD